MPVKDGWMLMTALAVAVLAATLATAAHATIDAGERTGLDTPYTPVAKTPPDGLFTMVAGTRYVRASPERGNLMPGSVTSFDTDLYATSFADAGHGFAAGSEVKDGVSRPVMYEYTEQEGWRRESEFPGPGPGFVAAIAWIDGTRALAVGGTGSYPDREDGEGRSTCAANGNAGDDPAGIGRAWLYDRHDGWRELERGAEFPETTRALTALDFYLPDPAKPVEFGILGGLCQIWHWKDGGFLRGADEEFEEPFSPTSDSAEKRLPPLVFRVRSISFARLAHQDPPIPISERKPYAYAVTSGCCFADINDRLFGAPVLLTYQPDTSGHPATSGSWDVQQPEPEDRRLRAQHPDSYLSVTATIGFARRPPVGFWDEILPLSTDSHAHLPPELGLFEPGLVETPGGPPEATGGQSAMEPPSRVGGQPTLRFRGSIRGDIGDDRAELSTMRLVDGSGDIGGGRPVAYDYDPKRDQPSLAIPQQVELAIETPLICPGLFGVMGGACLGGKVRTAPDGVPDWAVGVNTATQRGIAYGTDPGQLPPPDSAVERPFPPDWRVQADQPDTNSSAAAALIEYQKNPGADSERTLRALRSHALVQLPTYGLHAVSMLDEEGVGWAVGRHGAIVRVTPSGGREREGEPAVPETGGRGRDRVPDSSLWPLPDTDAAGAGDVPPARSSPRAEHRSREPVTAVVDSGPRRIKSIETSRTGTEAWAFPGPYHYDGESWNYCGDDEKEGYRDSHCQGAPPDVVAVTRVPLESDADPTNDDDFELLAITRKSYSGPDTRAIVRYRKGRWDDEPRAALPTFITGTVALGSIGNTRQLLDVAFTAPDDGWILADHVGQGNGPNEWFHFDGSSWRSCVIRSDGRGRGLANACDPDARFPETRSQGTITELSSAGDRLFAIGKRRIAFSALPPLPLQVAFLPETRDAPFIISRSRKDDGWRGGDRSYDLEYTGGPLEVSGTGLGSEIHRIAVARRSDGEYEGWALGRFGTSATGRRTLLRLEAGRGWRPFDDQGSFKSEARHKLVPKTGQARHLTTSSAQASSAIIGQGEVSGTGGLAYSFNARRNRWEPVDMNLPVAWTGGDFMPGASVDAVAPDGDGGFWLAVAETRGLPPLRTFFYRLTDRPREPVFREVAQPTTDLNSAIRALAADSDGTVWAVTGSSMVHRYRRGLGWSGVRIPGWEPTRSTVSSEANAIALDRAQGGLIVGKQGRIARILPGGYLELDPATSRPCSASPAPPCGTTQHLRAVDIADDGAAVAAGDGAALLYRTPGGEFARIEAPPVPKQTRFTGAAIADRSRMWLTTEDGSIWAGIASANSWAWREEAKEVEMRAIALDSAGRGYAVGSAILERTDDASAPWRRHSGMGVSVALVPGRAGVLIGGQAGEILTRTARGFEPAHPAQFRSAGRQDVLAVAAAGGYRDGEIEAWAVTDPAIRTGQRFSAQRLLHYSSTPADPLLNPTAGRRPLPDAPEPRTGEIAIAALGKVDCHLDFNQWCPPMLGFREFAERIARRSVEEISARATRTGSPPLAVFTGDATDGGGYPGNQVAESLADAEDRNVDPTWVPAPRQAGPERLRHWRMAVVDKLTDAGVPMGAAIGKLDLSNLTTCGLSVCVDARRYTFGGDNLAWRQTMAAAPAVWRGGSFSRYTLRRVRPPGVRAETPEVVVSDADKGENLTEDRTVPTRGAPTHYALDVIDKRDAAKPAARLIFLDSSTGSLAGSEATQNPLVLQGGQAAWLEQMLCVRGAGATAIQQCTRKPGQLAIVVTNAPTYSYGPGAGLDTAADGTALEAILIRYDANLVVSGRIGWNGLYWTVAPGVHSPCPGQEYRESPPGATAACDQASAEVPLSADQGSKAASQLVLGSALTGGSLAAEAGETAAVAGQGLLPSVIASGGGGPLADPNGKAREGFWYGYTVARLDPSGDPRKLIVEQRPVYDWIGITASERALRPGQRMRLRGYGRYPIGQTMGSLQATTRLDFIDGPAVTHRYDLLEADPKRPWLPLRDPDGRYVSLNPSIATVDRQSGQIRGGRGNHPRAYGIAMLSVGQHVASYPLVFEPRRTFAPSSHPSPRTPAKVVVQSAQAGIAPPASPGVPPQVGTVSPPVLPNFPSVPSPPATPPTGQPTPAPPPPLPPASSTPTVLALSTPPPGLTVAPPASVIPPPAPPINPAPPGGARKEARQRQAATEKSGSDAGASGESEARMDVDTGNGIDGAPGSQATRLDRSKAEPSITALSRSPRQPYAFTAVRAEARNPNLGRVALYGCGLTLMALTLALGWSGARPRPKARPPLVPAPAWQPRRRT